MRLNKITLILTSLLLILIPTTLFAQDDTLKLTQDYAYLTDYGTVIFSYPEDWGVAERVDLNAVSISNSLPLLEEPERGLGIGAFYATITATEGASVETPLNDSLEAFYAERFGAFDALEAILGNNQVAIGEPTNDAVDVRFYAVRFGDVIVYMDVVSNPGDMESQVEALDALIASIDFTTEQLVINNAPDSDVDTTSSQLVLSETFTVDDEFIGFLSVNYPQGWFAQEDGGGITISNVDIGNEFLVNSDEALESGEIAIGILALPAEDIDSLLGIEESDSPVDVLNGFIALLNEGTTAEDIQTFDMPDAQLTEIGNLNGAQSTGTLMLDGETTQEIQILTSVSDDSVMFILAVTGNNTLATYQQVVYDIVQSIEYRAP